MPIYEFKCTNCDHELSKIMKFSEPPLTHCPQCQQESLAKKMSQTSFQLKGEGWYVTDFKGGKTKKPEASSPPATAPTESASPPSPAAPVAAAPAPSKD